MNRRDFLQAIISLLMIGIGLVSAATGGRNLPEHYGGETVAPEPTETPHFD